MKHLLMCFLALAAFAGSNAQSCTPQPLLLKSPTLVSGSPLSVGAVYKFTNVDGGVNCFVKILAQHNGSISVFDDDATSFINAVQPSSITTSTPADPGWVKLLFDFRYASDSSSYYYKCLSVNVVDNDGSAGFAEKVSSLDVNSYSRAATSSITFSTDSFFNVLGTTTSFGGIDTNATAAMAEVGYRNITALTVKIGTYMTATNVTRQHCLYFKHFGTMTVTALPVKLTTFEGKQVANSVVLNWATSSESNNDYFEVERSENGSDYIPIGTIKGSGNSLIQRNYSFTDANPGKGNNYYRLRQTDYNGDINYPSKTLSINTNSNMTVELFPNPTQGKFTLSLKNYSNTECTIEVQNFLGQTLVLKTITIDKPNYEETLDLTGFEKGLYYLVTECNGEKHTEKVFLK